MALSAGSMSRDVLAAITGTGDGAANACRIFGDAVLANIVRDAEVTYTDEDGPRAIALSGGGTLTPSPTFEEMLAKLAALIRGLSHSPPSPGFSPAGRLTVSMGRAGTHGAATRTFCAQAIASVVATFPAPGMTIR